MVQKKIFVSVAAMAVAVLCAKATDFTYEGLTYTILSETQKTCQTKAGQEVVEDWMYWLEAGNQVSGDVTIPSTVYYNDEAYTVTGIGAMGFSELEGLTSITIGETVETIGEYAFSWCDALTKVDMPAALKKVDIEAFEYCKKLTEVNIGDLVGWCAVKFGTNNSNPLTFGKKLYINGVETTELTIPESVTVISANAFYGCEGLESVTIPAKVTNIGSSAFNNCSGLKGVYINDLTAWCNIDFNLSSTANPLQYAGTLYVNGEEVTELTIPEDVEKIGDYAFGGCTSLRSVTMGDNVKAIGNFAFYKCTGIESMKIGDAVEEIGMYVFYNNTSMTEVDLGKSLKKLNDYLFFCCSGLTEVTVPASVTAIGTAAFALCDGLESVEIGESVATINMMAFNGCDAMKDVYCLAEVPPTCNDQSFTDESEKTLHVPEGTETAYAEAAVWSRFGNIVADISGIRDAVNDSAEAEYYNLQGVRVAKPERGQLLIRIHGRTADKIIF